ncbi:protein kinase [Trypanosoma theileri]|uniref:Protein kinase n=1 Tax=Trypanosoma theileri TaxID=67003 RepID=A0A1X0NPK9_9TRYP|nr:protein kinase [Trypanosoma theileri]ORC86119.1 protein kinase [Trypanosoma theileri]
MSLNKSICRHPLASKRYLMIFRHEGEEISEMFELPTRYEALAPLAKGAYGFVCAARDNELVEKFQLDPPAGYHDSELTGKEREEMYDECTTVAVKKLRELFERNQPRMWLCASREIQLMMAFKHDNVMSATDFFIPLGECETMTYESVDYLRRTFDSVYIVMKKMDYTLREVLESTVFHVEDDNNNNNNDNTLLSSEKNIHEEKKEEKGEGDENNNNSDNNNDDNSGICISHSGEETQLNTVTDSVDSNEGNKLYSSRCLRCPYTDLVLHPLSREYRMFILYQLLRGVGYMHLCPVMHRDIKPENIMLDRNYNTCVCDFGQGRDAAVSEKNGILQTYLDNCTQWYAAPETLTLTHLPASVGFVDQMSFHGADVWSIGCIAAEMLMGRPLFYTKHRSGMDQLQSIMQVLGELSNEDVKNILQYRDQETRRVFHDVLMVEKERFIGKTSTLRNLLQSPYNDVDEEEIKLIENFLCYSPNRRMTIKEALHSPFFMNEGYTPVIDPDDTATKVNAVQASDIVGAVKGREFLWSLFLERHPEVQELIRVLQRKSEDRRNYNNKEEN